MVMPLLTQLFIDVYGWRGALLLVGGLNLHLILCGALLKTTTASEIYDVSESRFKDVSESLSTDVSESRSTGIPQTDRKLKYVIDNLGLNLFKSMEFLSLMSVAFGIGYTSVGWTMYLIPHALDVGFEPYDAALLATVGGIGFAVGAAVFPFVSKLLSNEQILCGCSVLTTISFLIDSISAVFYSYVGMMTSCAIFGVVRAMAFVILFKIVHADFGKQTATVAWLFFGYSIGNLSSAFLSGNELSQKKIVFLNDSHTNHRSLMPFFTL